MKRLFSKLFRSKWVMALLAVTLLGVGYVTATTVTASCDRTNIVYCGLTSANAAGIKNAYTTSRDTAGHTDIRAVMRWGGFTDGNIAGANDGNVKAGTLSRSGVVTVGGKTIGTSASVTTRLNKPGRTNILPGVYVRSSAQNEYANEQVLILFDKSGKAVAGIMIRCGNVIKFTPVIPKNPSLVCNSLTAVAVAGRELTYNFTANATVHDSTIRNYVFRYGDNASSTVTTSASTASSTHTYANYGTTYTASVLVNSVNNSNVTSTNCQVRVTTPPAKTPNISINKTVNGQEHIVVGVGVEFTYEITVKNTGNVTLTNAVVTDTPQAGVTLISGSAGSVNGNVWTVTIPTLGVGESKSYTLTAKVPVYKAGTIVNTVCVETPTIPGTNPDDCDTAEVEVPTPKVPHVSIDKVVNGQEADEVTLNEPFIYTLKVTNDGQVPLTQVVVTDPAPQHIQFISTDKGSVDGNKLTYTIPALGIRESVEIRITAKAVTYSPSAIKNTACVNAPEVNPENPTMNDDCDDATVTVPEPEKVVVCNPTTGEIIIVPVTDKDQYEPKDSVKCKMVPVCDETTGAVREVKWIDKDKYLPADSDKCVKIQVCIIADGTGSMVTITKDQYDQTKHSTNSADCKDIEVCRLSDKQTVTIKKSQLSEAYSTNPADCQEVPETPETPEVPTKLPSTGPEAIIGSLVGSSALSYGLYSYAASRRALKNR